MFIIIAPMNKHKQMGPYRSEQAITCSTNERDRAAIGGQAVAGTKALRHTTAAFRRLVLLLKLEI